MSDSCCIDKGRLCVSVSVGFGLLIGEKMIRELIWSPLMLEVRFPFWYSAFLSLQKSFIMLTSDRRRRQKLRPQWPNRKQQAKVVVRLRHGWARKSAPPPCPYKKHWRLAWGQTAAVTTVWCTSRRFHTAPSLPRILWVRIPAARTCWTLARAFQLRPTPAAASLSPSERWLSLQQSASSLQASRTTSRGRRYLQTCRSSILWGRWCRRDRTRSSEGTGGGIRVVSTGHPVSAGGTAGGGRSPVTFAVKLWPAWRTWRPTWGSTRARSPSSASSVENASLTPATWSATRACTPERSATAACTAGNASPSPDPWRCTWRCTRTANSSGVRTAARPSSPAATCAATSPFTQQRNASLQRLSDRVRQKSAEVRGQTHRIQVDWSPAASFSSCLLMLQLDQLTGERIPPPRPNITHRHQPPKYDWEKSETLDSFLGARLYLFIFIGRWNHVS